MAAKASGKTARAGTTTKKAKKPAVAAREKKPKKADSGAAGAESAKKKSAPKPETPGSQRHSTRQGPKKVDRQSLAGPIGRSAAVPEALVVPRPLEPGEHRNLGVVAGTGGPTACIYAGATDLCEVAPSGLVAVAGDTWREPRALTGGEWSPSLALHVGSLAGKIKFDGSFGWRNLYKDGWRDLDNGVWGLDEGLPPPGCSQLPAGTVRVGKKDYLLVTRTKRGLVPQDSRLVEIRADRPGWPTVPGSEKPASYQNFNQTQISGCEADGWVYVVADNFDRSKPVVLYRCRPDTFADRDSWAGWGMVNGDPKHWDWGQPPTPLCDHKFGELSLRRIDGKYVLSAFNATTYRIEVHVADDVRQILRPIDPLPPCTVVVDGRELPNLYGGYIVPGSTLDRARILVSQWAQDPVLHRPLESPYNVREYEVNLIR